MIDAAKFWDKAAAKYAKQPIENMDAYMATVDRTRTYLGAEDRVLEIGCGTGTTALNLCGNVGSYLASDVSNNMIDIGRQKAGAQGASNVVFQAASVGNVSPADGPFDAVLAFNLLHLLPNPDADLAKISSLLRPGGLFISKTICGFGENPPLKYRLIKIALPLMQVMGKAPFVRFEEAAALEDRIRKQGFEIVETAHFVTGFSVPFVVARKLA